MPSLVPEGSEGLLAGPGHDELIDPGLSKRADDKTLVIQIVFDEHNGRSLVFS